MAACPLDGEKLCDVSGKVKWSSVQRVAKDFETGSIALYKLSSSYYVHAITAAKRAKFHLKPGKFNMNNRDSRLTLSVTQDSTKASVTCTVSIHLKDAVPNQLRMFLDLVNGIKAYNASLQGKLSSFPSQENDIQDIENQPCNSINSNGPSTRVNKYESPLRSKLVSSSSSRSTQSVTPNRPSNYFAKQMNPPSSYNSQNKKTPLHDQTRARDNLNNTSISSSGRSVSSFYGSRNSWSPSERMSSTGKSLGSGLMPPPRSWGQTPRLASQISFRSRDKQLFEKEVTLMGFSNLGNTCYMNAILQSLLGIPSFVQDLSSKALLDRVHPQCLYRCLYNVMCCKRKCQNAEVLKNSLRKLKRTISEAATRFSGYHQHDAHEFLCQVFDQLRDDVNNCSSPSSKSTSKEINSKVTDSQCPVTRSFESGVLHTISCKQCGESAPKEEIYHAFSLDIPTLCNLSGSALTGTVNMQTLIKKHFEDEELEYTCSKCDSKEAVISHSFSRLPRVLILHLKRYGYDNLTEEQEKKQDKVNIERFIGLEMLCSSKTKAPLPFQVKSSLKLGPLKSRQKSQKRHFIKEDDDDDDDFQPLPPVRRKLDHSFSNTVTSSSTQDSSSSAKGNAEDDVEDTGTCKLDMMDECNSSVNEANGKDFTEVNADGQGDNLDVHCLENEKPVWEGTEEEQMKWALEESAKSAEKKAKTNLKKRNVNKSGLEYTGKSTGALFVKDSPQKRKKKPEEDVKITGEFKNVSTVITSKKDCMESSLDVDLSGSENPVWARTEEEQMKWALAESARLSAEKKSRAELKAKEEQAASQTKWTEELESPKSTLWHDNGNDFFLMNHLSDEDLVNAAQESGTDEPWGLKGGGPITTDSCPGDVDLSDINNTSLVNDENSKPENCKDSGVEKSSAKSCVLKSSPIMYNFKRKNGHLQRKRKTLESDVLNKTPTLGKFDGDLFNDVAKENKNSSKTLSPSGGTKSSLFRSSFPSFSDDDMEKAINMSLQEQQMSNNEDEELKRALELSLQEFEGKCPIEEQPAALANLDVADTKNVTGSAFQNEESRVSTHSYRLVSIVSHLGARSTSGHYISDVYDCKTKQWTSYDDSTATKVAEHGVRYKRQQSGYIFFYLYKQCVDAIENASPSKENSQR